MSFIKAIPIWAQGYQKEMNITVICVLECSKDNLKTFSIAANNFYRIFVNGKFFAYGPARAPHGFARVDTYTDLPLSDDNRIVIEVLSNHCRSFYSLDTDPFIQFESYDDEGAVTNFSSLDTPIYLNTARLQKVVRFSYQRGFSESYRYTENTLKFLTADNYAFPIVNTCRAEEPKLLLRTTPFPNYYELAYELFEFGDVRFNHKNKIYEDRYMYLESIGIFDPGQWEIDSNKTASSFVFQPAKRSKCTVSARRFVTYRFPVSKTGFITVDVKACQDSLIYIIFDEIDKRKGSDNLTQICFYRNTTHNCITYELKKGQYELMSFEPYTAKLIRVIVLSGRVEISSVGIVEYENPTMNHSRFEFDDRRLMAIIEAARNTLAQNAVDILTDCPSRERAGWLFDSYFSARAEQLFTGKNLIETCFLENYALCPKTDLPQGMIPMCYPSDYEKNYFIPNWALWYIIELEDYFRRTGDSDLIHKSLNNINGLLKYFNSFENEDGLLENLESWIFVEWSQANDPDHVCGVNYPSNMLYAGALKAAGSLLNDNSLFAKAESIISTIRSESFDGSFFVDNSIRIDGVLTPTSHITETCQYYAFYFDIATKETYPSLFENMMNNFGPKRNSEITYPNICKSNVLPGHFLRLEILNRYKYFNKVLDETVDYFYKMASLTGTLWEHDSVTASLNHAFASYAANIILRPTIGFISVNKDEHTIFLENTFLLRQAKVDIKIGDESLIINIENGRRTVKEPSGYLVKIIS